MHNCMKLGATGCVNGCAANLLGFLTPDSAVARSVVARKKLLLAMSRMTRSLRSEGVCAEKLLMKAILI